MRPTDDIKRLIKNAKMRIDPEVKKASLAELVNELEKSKRTYSAASRLSILKKVAKSRIAKVAAILIFFSAIYLFTLNGKDTSEQNEVARPEMVTINETPAEMINYISLTTTFRDGGMKAVEEQFDKAEKKVKSDLDTHLTVDQLICELGGC